MYITISEWHEKLTAPGVDIVGRFENLAEDASHILHMFAPDAFNKEVVYERMNNNRVNTSEHLHYSEYYKDKGIAEIVNRWDECYMNKFNYSL